MRATAADPLDGPRLLVVLSTVAINIVAVALLTLAPWSNWRSAVAINLVNNGLLIGFAVRRRDSFLARLLVFGLAAGFAELPTDAWLVDDTGTLDYSAGGGPMVWRSPCWMPFAWETVVVQFGYIGLLLWERLGRAGLLAAGVLGAINIPYYEEMARRIHWWSYRGCRMISHTPYYIILGEFGIAITLAYLARPLRRPGLREACWRGAVAGGAMFGWYGAAYLLTDVW